MKQLQLTGLFLLLTFNLWAQNNINYYDYNWKPCSKKEAAYYSTSLKTDSGIVKLDYFTGTNSLQMEGKYTEDNKRNGLFTYYHPNGKIASIGKYVNDKREGYWYTFFNDESMRNVRNYQNNVPFGVSKSWHSNGSLHDSIYYAGSKSFIKTWFDNGQVSSFGNFDQINERNYGDWKYYHGNGQLSGAVKLNKNNHVIAATYYNENGEEDSDNAIVTRSAFYGDETYTWQKYLAQNLKFPKNGLSAKLDKGVVVVEFYIDEEGNIVNPIVTVPVSPACDLAALELIRKSKKWQPTISRNRKVKQWFRQPITFLYQ